MPVTVNKHGKTKPVQDARKPKAFIGKPRTAPALDEGELRVFGRLRMSTRQMADYYGMPVEDLRRVMQRPEHKRAYNQGRARTVLAIREKQVSMALAGDTRMLIHVGGSFGGLDEFQGEDTVDRAPGPSWDDEVEETSRALLEALEAERAREESDDPR